VFRGVSGETRRFAPVVAAHWREVLGM